MIPFILANWKYAVAAIVTAIAAWFLHSADVSRIKAGCERELTAQASAIAAQCRNAQSITSGVSSEYQKKLADLNAQLAQLKRMRPASCVPVHPAQPATGCDGSAAAGELRGSDGRGVDSGWLYDFAGRAEQTRQQLMACQDFIRNER